MGLTLPGIFFFGTFSFEKSGDEMLSSAKQRFVWSSEFVTSEMVSISTGPASTVLGRLGIPTGEASALAFCVPSKLKTGASLPPVGEGSDLLADAFLET